MKLALAFLILSISLGCSRNDSSQMNSADLQLKNALIGTWTHHTNNLSGTINFASDGTFKSGLTNLASNPIHSWQYEGYWTVTDGVCVTTVTKSESVGTTNKPPEGTVRLKIMKANAENLVWESDSQTISLTRKK
jgi:hypothetical protein